MRELDSKDIKGANRIEEVIGRYVKLTFRGSKAVGLCPFHDDRHPSLRVDSAKQTFHCYACGTGGDVIAFVMRREGCNFKEALEKLATPDLKITLVQKKEPEKPSPRDMPDHTLFLPYLMPYAMGIGELSETYLTFEVGLAPRRVPRLWWYLADRLVFPLRDTVGRLVGFSGRSLQEEKTPKYCNTSTKEGYNRTTFLYGLYRAKAQIRRTGRVYVTEGYKDTLAMHAAGFVNTVGLCGTQLSEGQLTLLTEDVTEVVLLLDGDAAGRKAAATLQERLTAAGVEVIDIVLPEGEDPDGLFRRWGKERFAAWVMEEANPPDPLEGLLVYSALTYPEAMAVNGGEMVRYTKLIPSLLEMEQIPFACAAYMSLLEHGGVGGTVDTLPEDLQRIWKELMQTEPAELKKLEASLPSDTPAKEIGSLLTGRILYRYIDERLLKLIRGLMRAIRYEENPAVREQLLYALRYRKEQHEAIAHLLEYPGAVW